MEDAEFGADRLRLAWPVPPSMPWSGPGRGLKVGLLRLITLWPFPRAALERMYNLPGPGSPGDEHGPDLPGGETGEPGQVRVLTLNKV